MEELFKNLGNFIRDAEYGSFDFWFFPVITVLLIWLATVISLKVFKKRKKLKEVFMIHRIWIACSLVVAAVLIGLICYWWSVNYFSYNPLQFSLLISLIIAFIIPIVHLYRIRNSFTNEGLKEITSQPKTQNQLENIIIWTKKSFNKNKLFYLIPVLGFLLLLFSLNKGQNLISIIFDNSESMKYQNAMDALSETFNSLEKNNEMVLTTLDGLGTNSIGGKNSIDDILSISDYSRLRGGNVVSFNSPVEAKEGLNQLTNMCWGSPICEAIWKSFLFIKNTKANQKFNHKLLIIITDGNETMVAHTLASSQFFFDKEEFNNYFPPERVFIIDYSGGEEFPLFQKFNNAGCERYSVTDNEQEYIYALDDALKSFKNNWTLIFWTIIFTTILTLAGLFVEPKKVI
jgi:hypothetical protein